MNGVETYIPEAEISDKGENQLFAAGNIILFLMVALQLTWLSVIFFLMERKWRGAISAKRSLPRVGSIQRSYEERSVFQLWVFNDHFPGFVQRRI